ncbi:autotransporter outer membrane beta-barrel domain-containing protein [Campylobacter sp.]|uniref:autotransporter outer membrane beta-barrel domain-containing protein n=1 Tax=Campylobacter sp. TaxID=205 RepID=UPI0026DB8F5D|nr:autotransporter outer membrane beta-barrel domain-containing protein [Campylobacter sp.]MDO4674821.1 autotransporter outer membrane beta-barrel domain-containing protein [Campylobacter sp.]
MKRTIVLLSLPVFLNAVDYQNSTFPASLQVTTNQTDKAIIDCNSQPQSCVFNYQGTGATNPFTVTISDGITYNLEGQNPTTGIPANKRNRTALYFESLTQNGGTFKLSGFNQYILTQNLSITGTNSAASITIEGLDISNSTFSTPKNMILNKATLKTEKIKDFLVVGTSSFTQATLQTPQATFKGDLTLDKDSQLIVDKLILTGQDGTKLEGSTLTVQNEGSIRVKNDLYNGSKTNAGTTNDLCATLGMCGNAKFVNKGGTISVEGKWVSETFTGQNLTHSTLEIQGGTVTVKGGFENKQDSSIKFTPHNGQMGQLIVEGSGLDNKGNIDADITGITTQGNIDLIQGNISGNNQINITASNMTETKSCPDGSIMVGVKGQPLTCPTTGGGGSGSSGGSQGGGSGGGSSGGGAGGGKPPATPQIQQLEKLVYGESANANGRALLRSLAMDEIVKPSTTRKNRRALTVNTLASSSAAIQNFFVVSSYNANVLADIIDDADKGIRMSYLSLPNASLDAMRDREWLSGGREYANFDLSTFGSGFLGEGRGYTFGVRLNAYKEFNDNLLRFEGDFGYSSLLKRDDYHKASSKGRIFGLGLSQYYDFGTFETHNRLYAGYGNFDTSRTIVFPAFNLNATGGYDYAQLHLQNLLFYKLENGLKPFVGLEQNFNHRSKIDENGNAVPLKMPTLNAYNVDGILGLSWGGSFEEGSFVNLSGGLLATLINTEKRQHFTSNTGEILSYKAPYRFKAFMNSGLYYYFLPNALLGVEGFYKNSFNKSELGYLGGNLVFKWEF